jgi:hypothetical protein
LNLQQIRLKHDQQIARLGHRRAFARCAVSGLDEMRRVRRKQPQMLGAWECAMRAQWHLARLTREDLVEAHRPAAQATVLDPGASLGFNIDAFTDIHEVAHGWSTSVMQSVLAAYQAAMKAVALDSRDAASQTALGACEVLMRRFRRSSVRQSICHQSLITPADSFGYTSNAIITLLQQKHEQHYIDLRGS